MRRGGPSAHSIPHTRNPAVASSTFVRHHFVDSGILGANISTRRNSTARLPPRGSHKDLIFFMSAFTVSGGYSVTYGPRHTNVSINRSYLLSSCVRTRT